MKEEKERLMVCRGVVSLHVSVLLRKLAKQLHC